MRPTSSASLSPSPFRPFGSSSAIGRRLTPPGSILGMRRADELGVLEEIERRASERLGGNEHGAKAVLALRAVGEGALVTERLALVADGEPRVNRGNREAHVAHVGRSGTDARVRLARTPAERLE